MKRNLRNWKKDIEIKGGSIEGKSEVIKETKRRTKGEIKEWKRKKVSNHKEKNMIIKSEELMTEWMM